MNSPVKNVHRFRQWVEKRWPLSAVVRWGSVEEIPGGAKFAYVLGSATLFLFALLVITGVWQMLYYVPTVDHAYDSLMYLRLQVPFGWLVHGLHYWAAQGFIVVMGLHVARVFIWAAYKKPRELTWVLGVVLLLLGGAFIFTGAILPWDTTGYWAGEVGTNMAGTVPLMGNFLKLLMRGGDTMGQMTLSRAFVVHIAILPGLTVFFIAAHLVAFRQFGSVGPWNPKKWEKTGWFWPHQTFKDLLVIALILVVLICLSAFVRVPITGPADPLDNSYAPKPEWNFLFLYEALKAFKGSWEWMGTVVIPLLLVLLLFAVPFIDRNEKRNPLRRPIAMLCGFLFVAVILVLTFIGHYSDSGAPTATASATGRQQPGSVPAAAASAPNSTAPAASVASMPPHQVAATEDSASLDWQTRLFPGRIKNPVPADATSVKAGQAIYAGNCLACHGSTGTGNGRAAIALSKRVADLSAPAMWAYNDGQLYGKVTLGQGEMPKFENLLTENQRWEVVNYIRTLAPKPAGFQAKTPETATSVSPNTPTKPDETHSNPASPMAEIQEGRRLFTAASCVSCHAMEGKGGTTGPDLSNEAKFGRASQWLITQIADPAKHNPSTVMPAHKNLTQPQLKDLAEFILNPSSSPTLPSASTELKAETPPSGPSSKAAQEKQSTAGDSSRSTIPALGASGATGSAVKIIGDPRHGATLFSMDCAKCHGNAGEGNVPNPGSLAGMVSRLAPISRRLFSEDPLVFSGNIDRLIQHGATPPGPGPVLRMPAFGDTKSLTQPEIANIEAYILSLNGVDQAKIINPGIIPLLFVEGTVILISLGFFVIAGLWFRSRASLSTQRRTVPTRAEIQDLKHEVGDLKDKLDETQKMNPKDSSGI